MDRLVADKGRARWRFKDADGVKQTIQDAGPKVGSHVWLGVADGLGDIRVSPRVHSASSRQGDKWETLRDALPEAKEIAGARMLLSREMAGKLAVVLKRFHETGDL